MGELTVNCAFDPSIHLTVRDLQVDAEVNPSSLQVHIKSSKTDPFRQGCFIYLGRGQAPLCPVSTILAYLHRRGPSSGPLSIDTHGQPLTRSRLSSFIQSVLQGAGIPGHFSGHWGIFHWGCHHGRAMRHSRSPYQDLGQVVQ